MTDLPPEAYLRLWPQKALPSPVRISPMQSGPEGKLLSALASTLVSEPRGEAYALARSHAPHSLVLFVAGSSGAVPHLIQNHCHLIVGLMYKISAAVKHFESESPGLHSLSEVPQTVSGPIKELRRVIARHNLPKFRKRVFKETDEDWHSHRTQIEDRIADDQQISCYRNLIDLVNDIRDTAVSGVDEDIILACRKLNDLMKEEETKSLVDFLEKGSRADNWSIKRYIEKLLKVFRSVDRLIITASSSKLRPIFEQEPQIIFATSSPRTLRFTLHGILPSLWKTVGMDEADELTQEGFPHCDCALLAYFLENRIENIIPVIGISRLTCFASELYFKAFSIGAYTLEEDIPVLSLVNKDLHPIGTHNKICSGYVRPNLSVDYKELDEVIASIMRSNLKDSLKREMWRLAPPRIDNTPNFAGLCA